LWNTPLSGPIPSSIGQLVYLWHLQLASSSFSGTLPETLGSLTQLYYLDVSSNCLSGTLPESLAALRGVYDWNYLYILLHSNRLQGKPMPRPGCHIHIATIDTLITIHAPTDARHMPSSY
jgi:hypothetical protein